MLQLLSFPFQRFSTYWFLSLSLSGSVSLSLAAALLSSGCDFATTTMPELLLNVALPMMDEWAQAVCEEAFDLDKARAVVSLAALMLLRAASAMPPRAIKVESLSHTQMSVCVCLHVLFTPFCSDCFEMAVSIGATSTGRHWRSGCAYRSRARDIQHTAGRCYQGISRINGVKVKLMLSLRHGFAVIFDSSRLAVFTPRI